jgi:hypothetical protein
MKNRAVSCGICIHLSLVCAFGCSRVAVIHHRQAVAQHKTLNGAAMYVFHDRSDAKLEHLYSLKGKVIFGQVAAFPGFRARKSYMAEKLRVDVLQLARSCAVEPGEIDPPFKPHGPWFSRADLSQENSREVERAFFQNDNPGIQRLFQRLRETLIRDELRIEALPEWIRSNQRAKRQPGLDDSQEGESSGGKRDTSPRLGGYVKVTGKR